MRITTSLGRISTATFAVFTCFVLLGLLGIHLKFAMFDQSPIRVAMLAGNYHLDQSSGARPLGYYFDDILICLVLAPLFATILITMIFRRYRVGVAACICIVISTLLFFEQNAFTAVGNYVSRSYMIDSIHSGLAEPSLAASYVSRATLAKFAAIILAFVVIWILARVSSKRVVASPPPTKRPLRFALSVPAASVWVLAVAVAPISFAMRDPGSPLNTSNATRAFSVLLSSGANVGLSGLGFNQALAEMRTLTRTPPLDSTNPLVGSERGANVLVFVMETGPAKSLDLPALASHLPGTAPLFQHAFVARHQYTTYPYTSNAVYSILSGLYPQGRSRLLLNLRQPSLNGLMTALGPDVPVRSVFMPGLSGLNLDSRMYAVFGAKNLYLSDTHPNDPLRVAAEQRADALIAQLQREGSVFDKNTLQNLKMKLVLDYQALARAKAEITTAAHSHKRFLVAFLPQVAHGPWIALHNESSVVARGHDLMLLEDQWLRELVNTLQKADQLDNTIIVFTADHGVRTRIEDPSLQLDKLSDYMFHVPLLIYAPHLKQTVFIENPSSHIDVAPTVLALLGNTGEVEEMEGTPIWQREPDQRLYFWAGAYGGVDGLEENGEYYMHQYFTDAVFRNNRLDFPNETIVQHSSPAESFTKNALSRADLLQETMVSRWIDKKQQRSSGLRSTSGNMPGHAESN